MMLEFLFSEKISVETIFVIFETVSDFSSMIRGKYSEAHEGKDKCDNKLQNKLNNEKKQDSSSTIL